MLVNQSFYNRVRQSDYNADGYLAGVERVKKDYRELFNEYRGISNVIFIVDPPYLTTNAGTYKEYWNLREYLDVLNVLYDSNYIYFTSSKSTIIELMEWVGDNLNGKNPFKGAKTTIINASTGDGNAYKDIMLSKCLNAV